MIHKSFFLTGATGFLGSFILNRLLDEGCSINLLCRSKGDISAVTRIGNVLKWFEKNINDFPGLKIFEGDLGEEKFGLENDLYSEILEGMDEIIHCASDTDFSERNREDIEKTNIYALKSVLDLVESPNVSYFHYISTAYSCGNGNVKFTEKLYHTNEFTNVYEESKNKAEHLVNEICSKQKVKFSIYRPSIVYGDSITGKSRKFNALYFPVKSLAYLKKIMLKDIYIRDGKRAEKLGVYLKDNGNLFMPIRIKYLKGSLINIIPIDYFISVIIKIISSKEKNTIYNITSDSPTNFNQLSEYACKYLGIEGFITEENEIPDKTPLEKLFNSYIDAYLPYIEDFREFDITNTENVLKGSMICPEMDYVIFKKCMDYAISVDWGRDLD